MIAGLAVPGALLKHPEIPICFGPVGWCYTSVMAHTRKVAHGVLSLHLAFRQQVSPEPWHTQTGKPTQMPPVQRCSTSLGVLVFKETTAVI